MVRGFLNSQLLSGFTHYIIPAKVCRGRSSRKVSFISYNIKADKKETY